MKMKIEENLRVLKRGGNPVMLVEIIKNVKW